MNNIFLLFLENFKSVFGTTNKLLNNAIAALKTVIDTLKALLPQDSKSETTTASITKSKDDSFQIMKDATIGMCRLALEWAKATPTAKSLIKAFKVNATSFQNSEPEDVALSYTILGLLNDNDTEIIAATDITALQITDFKNIIIEAEKKYWSASSTKGAVQNSN